MTTTAEKIDELRRRQSAAENEIKKIGEELALLRFPELKATDTKPLEYWVNYYGENRKAFLYRIAAQAVNACRDGGRTVHVHEVTLQMKQNELDAKRYRRYKELAKSQAQNWYLRPDKWDEEIDKWMEK